MLSILLFIIAGFMVISALLTINSVGKPKPAITGGVASGVVAINMVLVTILVIAAITLQGV